MKNILVITYWSFRDPLVQTYTLPYAKIIRKKAGGKLFLVTFEHPAYRMSREEQTTSKKLLSGDHIVWVWFNYRRLGFLIFFLPFILLRLGSLILFKRITGIHCWCTPAGTIGYLLSRITGKPLVLDSFEPHAEAMVENGTWDPNGNAFRTLFRYEKKQAGKAAHVIGLTASMRMYSKEKYGTDPERFYVKPACVDLQKFNPERFPDAKRKFGLEGKIVCVYSGKVGGIYLEKEVFDFLKCCEDHWKDKFVALILSPVPEREIREVSSHSGCDPKKMIIHPCPHDAVPEHLAAADFALNPVKPVPTKRHCTSIKDGEYWAMGLPVVITKGISDDSEIIEKNAIGSVLQDLSQQSYLRSVQEIDKLLRSDRKALQLQIRKIAEDHRNFSIADRIYSEIYSKA